MIFWHRQARLNLVRAPVKQFPQLGDVRARKIICYVLKCASVQMPVKILIVMKRRTSKRAKTNFPILSDKILSNILH